eukprot:6022711-Amphidinium_carterae.1
MPAMCPALPTREHRLLRLMQLPLKAPSTNEASSSKCCGFAEITMCCGLKAKLAPIQATSAPRWPLCHASLKRRAARASTK